MPLPKTGIRTQLPVDSVCLQPGVDDRTILRGLHRSYAEIARAFACPTATRAVGATYGSSPISIIVTCHRAIAPTAR